jgi:hypothetical protein
MKLVKSALAILALSASQVAVAATQGTPGPTSTGTVTINATITPEVNITNLNDFTFTATELRTALNTGTEASQFDRVCVWSNNPDRSYFIIATGSGASNVFSLTDGTRTLAYSVQWADNNSGVNMTALTSGAKSSAFSSPAGTPDCGGSPRQSLRITIANAAIAAMEASTAYTGVLTLLVSPT